VSGRVAHEQQRRTFFMSLLSRVKITYFAVSVQTCSSWTAKPPGTFFMSLCSRVKITYFAVSVQTCSSRTAKTQGTFFMSLRSRVKITHFAVSVQTCSSWTAKTQGTFFLSLRSRVKITYFAVSVQTCSSWTAQTLGTFFMSLRSSSSTSSPSGTQFSRIHPEFLAHVQSHANATTIVFNDIGEKQTFKLKKGAYFKVKDVPALVLLNFYSKTPLP
jgi:hypothetical protein